MTQPTGPQHPRPLPEPREPGGGRWGTSCFPPGEEACTTFGKVSSDERGLPPAAQGSLCPPGRPTPAPVCPSALPPYQQDTASGPEPGLPAQPWAAPHWPWVLSVLRLAPGTPLPLTLTLQHLAFRLCTFTLQFLFPELLISPPQRPSSERPSHPPDPQGARTLCLTPSGFS